MVYPSLIASTFACFLALANADYVKFDAKKLKGSWSQNADVQKYPIYAYYKENVENSTASNNTVIGVYNDKIYYAVDLSFGSDAQNITVLVDTVSSDLWINSIENKVCAQESEISNISIAYAYSYSASSKLSSSITKSSLTSSTQQPISTSYVTSYDSSSDIYVINGIVSTDTTTTKVETTSIGKTNSHDVKFYPSASKTNYLSEYPHPTYSVDTLEILEFEPQNCSSWGLFDSNSSKSFITNNEIFDSYSLDLTPIEGIWAKDFVLYGNSLLSNVSFGLVSDSLSDSFGVLGLGLPSFESTWLSEGKTYDDGFLSSLKSQGFIEKSVYAIYDNYLSDNSSLLFGGIDLNAFEGNLSILPLIEVPIFYNDSRNASAIAITLSSIYFDDNYNDNNETSLLASGLSAAIIDTSLSTAVLPYYIYDTIISTTGFKYSENLNAFIANSSQLTNKSIVFDFQGIEIDIPIVDLTFPLVDIESEEISDFVVFAADATPNDTFVLGDSILQYLYIAIDLDDYEIAIAPKNFSQESEDIVEIIDSFPNATSVASYNYTYGYHGVTDLKLATVYNPNSISKTSFSLSYIPSATPYSTASESYTSIKAKVSHIITSARPSSTSSTSSTSSESSEKSEKSSTSSESSTTSTKKSKKTKTSSTTDKKAAKTTTTSK
ncbi:hypothetical protein C6P40_001239 [Pichia californica]|uniref:Peptidase A1 domain-containing protein n=1 Tax=Pichia californica TaxID=460514 RepID=A0A9P6WPP0_9ASCO|nr:hypothetical protein C6P42_004405 [[Candida] californica]KAG0690805.1 hypothetical protein C6P40_001239 [[Candida] californica]